MTQRPDLPTVLLREWTTTGPTDEPLLAGCRAFTREEADHAASLSRQGRLEILEVRGGLRVTTRSYVGVVALGPVTLHIRPKLAYLDAPAMAALLRYALGLDAVDLHEQTTPNPLDEWGFADLLAQLLLDEVNALLRAGLLRDYQTLSGWRSSPRGKLDVGEMARHPLRTRTTFALPCRYEERTADTVLNRLTRATLDALAPQVSDSGIAFDMQARSALLGELCGSATLSAALWEQATASLDRRSHHYRPLVEIAALVLSSLGMTVDTAVAQTPLNGFLLDMNRLFERAVARLLEEYAPPTLQVTAQDERATAYRWASNPFKWQRPGLRPDLVVTEKATGAPRLVLDTKYKPLGPGRRPSAADLYQLTLYSLSFGVSGQHVPARIVHPAPSDVSAQTLSRLDFQGLSNQNTQAQIEFFGLALGPLTAALRRSDTGFLQTTAAALLAV